MRLNNAARVRLTTSVFSTTFLIAIVTVAIPQVLPCPSPVVNPVGLDVGQELNKKLTLTSQIEKGTSIISK
ncbi:uncharacterized protein V1516DRAFT_669179 [Lipomyces oligophaga]|uniref:uncharacterized protein n=1 Tax=Lipomyces oligophaga TaxID=45792 RepID=UPI0034CF7518